MAAFPPARGPRSRPTQRVKLSIIIANSERESAASHRPFELSSRMNACCACTSMNWGQLGQQMSDASRRTESVTSASSNVWRISVRPARLTWVSCGQQGSCSAELTCLPNTSVTSPLPVRSPFLTRFSVSSDLPLPRVAEWTLSSAGRQATSSLGGEVAERREDAWVERALV